MNMDIDQIQNSGLTNDELIRAMGELTQAYSAMAGYYQGEINRPKLALDAVIKAMEELAQELSHRRFRPCDIIRGTVSSK